MKSTFIAAALAALVGLGAVAAPSSAEAGGLTIVTRDFALSIGNGGGYYHPRAYHAPRYVAPRHVRRYNRVYHDPYYTSWRYQRELDRQEFQRYLRANDPTSPLYRRRITDGD